MTGGSLVVRMSDDERTRDDAARRMWSRSHWPSPE